MLTIIMMATTLMNNILKTRMRGTTTTNSLWKLSNRSQRNGSSEKAVVN